MSKQFKQQKCLPCELGAPPMEPGEVQQALRQIGPQWRDEGARQISRQFVFRDFAAAMTFVNAVAALAEDEGHHPDLVINYNKVLVALTTHAASGLTANDFIVAAKIDLI
ncbi:MAG TPA: 4a-hydroxytetrahydrobiopterin dehydratase, partial [Candidatus Saccharimonadales bacterium]|nr:4a-hydroxytetrahydrobiopterin dehydratase [Candidatus Saccharimonadales bacterium]